MEVLRSLAYQRGMSLMQTGNSFRLQQYVDPLFGSERYVTFEADWIDNMEEGYKWLIFRPKAPVTKLYFKSGITYTVHGHWAERIKAAQSADESP